MRRGRYLNFILTVNAVLLTALVWTQLVGGPVLSSGGAAQAQVGRDVPGIPNAASQRHRMIELMTEMNRNMGANHKLLDDGRLRVRVTNLDEIQRESADSGD